MCIYAWRKPTYTIFYSVCCLYNTTPFFLRCGSKDTEKRRQKNLLTWLTSLPMHKLHGSPKGKNVLPVWHKSSGPFPWPYFLSCFQGTAFSASSRPGATLPWGTHRPGSAQEGWLPWTVQEQLPSGAPNPAETWGIVGMAKECHTAPDSGALGSPLPRGSCVNTCSGVYSLGWLKASFTNEKCKINFI